MAVETLGVGRPCTGAAGTTAVCVGTACGAVVVGTGGRGSWRGSGLTSCVTGGSTGTSGLGAGFTSGGGSSGGGVSTFCSVFSCARSGGWWGTASHMTCSGPGGGHG